MYNRSFATLLRLSSIFWKMSQKYCHHVLRYYCSQRIEPFLTFSTIRADCKEELSKPPWLHCSFQILDFVAPNSMYWFVLRRTNNMKKLIAKGFLCHGTLVAVFDVRVFCVQGSDHTLPCSSYCISPSFVLITTRHHHFPSTWLTFSSMCTIYRFIFPPEEIINRPRTCRTHGWPPCVVVVMASIFIPPFLSAFFFLQHLNPTRWCLCGPALHYIGTQKRHFL